MRNIKKLAKAVARKIFNLLRKVKRKLIRLKLPKFYIEKGEYYQKQGNTNKARSIFIKGLKHYPNNYTIRKQIALDAMVRADSSKAVRHWKALFKANKKRIKAEDFIKYSEALLSNNELKQAIDILKRGLEKHPKEKGIVKYFSKIVQSTKQWDLIIEVLIILFEEDMNPEIKDDLNLANAYSQLGNFNRAEYILRKGIELYPENKDLLYSYSNIAVKRKSWDVAIQCLEYLCQLYVKEAPFDHLIKLSMLYQITGQDKKAQNLFNETLDQYQKEIENDEKGFRKIIIYDNGESRIEFYKSLNKTNKVIVTFDSLNMVWKNPPFAFKLLREQKIDIVAVRKREKKTYHQDLSIGDFVNSVEKLVGSYKKKYAYGFSLGAYAALYYASNIDCHILSLAPRLSIHPKYGKEKTIPLYEFNHNMSLNYNENIKPIIVYDPKDPLDSTYVHKEIIPAFPNAQLVKIPYGGHSMAPHLLRMGLLKEFILTVIKKEEVPKYDRKLKAKSANYCRLLGRACLRRKKIAWAKELSDRAYKLLPKDKYVIRLRVDVFRKLNQYEDAIDYMKEAIDLVPKMLYAQNILIDLYIETKDLVQAEKYLKKAINQFGERPELVRRQQKIDEVREEIINTPLELFEKNIE